MLPSRTSGSGRWLYRLALASALTVTLAAAPAPRGDGAASFSAAALANSDDAYQPGQPLVTPPHAVKLVVETATGAHRFDIELRDDDEGRMVGLMHRKTMPANHGMLFDFEDEKTIAMWMKNTLLPLDMLFIRADGVIHSIAANTQPLSTRIIPSGGPIRYVLELNAGAAARIGARPGDTVVHPAIGP